MSKNFSNTTSATATTSAPDIIFINMDIANKVFNTFCLAVHVAYFILVILSRDLRTRALLFINHAVLTNLFYPLGAFVFLWFDPNTIANKEQVRLLCSFFEIFWSFSIYSRMYAILLIAIHRYLAVFKPDLFKRMNSSIPLLILPIVLLWLVSIALPFIFKYAFSTTYSVTNCLAGFSTIWLNSLLHALFYITFSLIFPTIAIISIYIVIAKKLRVVGKSAKKMRRGKGTAQIKISKISTVDNDNTSFSVRNSSKAVIISKKRELKFANQFILMCLLVVLTVCGIGIFSLRGVIPNYFNLFYYWRPIIRCWILFFSSLLPIFSVYFNPSRRKIVNFLRSHTSNSASIGDIKY